MSFDDDFDTPASTAGSGFTPADYSGRLLLITPNEVKKEFKTQHGTDDAVAADVVVLDGPGAPEELPDSLFFGMLAKSLAKTIKDKGPGRKVLGRLGQGAKSPGKNPPWLLADPTDSDKRAARDYLDKQVEAPF